MRFLVKILCLDFKPAKFFDKYAKPRIMPPNNTIKIFGRCFSIFGDKVVFGRRKSSITTTEHELIEEEIVDKLAPNTALK